MTEKRTVKINGEELEVEITINDDGSYDATVEGQTFTVEIPNAQAAPRARRGGSIRPVRCCLAPHMPHGLHGRQPLHGAFY